MATNYDVMFLRLLIEGGRLRREQGLACLKRIDGTRPAPNAAQVLLLDRLVDESEARACHERVMAHFAQSGEVVAQMSREDAMAGVSGELRALPKRSPVGAARPEPARSEPASSGPPSSGPPSSEPPSSEPEPRYFDLGTAGEGLEGYQLGPLIAHGTCYSSYRGRGPAGEPVRILTLSSRFQGYPELEAEVGGELTAWLGFRHRSGSGPLKLGKTLARGDRPAQTVAVYPASEGQLLSEFLAEHGPLESEEALDLVLDLCEFLAAAHPKGLAVGDLRSDGVLYDGERALLLDLGLGRANCVASGYAGHGIPFGHPGYLAPEVIQDRQREPAPASDIYALGILFYELICGQLPYEGGPLEQLEQHFASPLPPPPEEVSFSTTTAGVILRMTAKTLAERAQSAPALAKALAEFRAGRTFRIPVGRVDPLPLGAEPVSHDEWADTAARAAEGEGRDWTESMLDATPRVGPSDLQPLASGSLEFGRDFELDLELGVAIPGGGPVSARLPREMRARLLAEAESEEDGPGDDPEPETQLGPRPSAPAPAERVHVGEKLGRGAIGASYEGSVPGRAGPLVLKAISRKFVQHTEILAQLRQDLRQACGVQGETVVAVLDLIEADERDLIVSERAAGQTLRHVLAGRPRLSLDEVVGLARDLSRALGAGLAAGMSHGDIRPDKVYLDEAGRARLADFGHARGSCLGAGLGKYGLFFGHPHYVAPEVLSQRKEQPELASDLYAVGVLLYEALCGVLPFRGQGIRKTLLAQLKQPLPPPPAGLVVPHALAETIIRLTNKDPRQRYASLEDLNQALDVALEASMASGEALRLSDVGSAPQVEEFDPLASSMGGEAREAWGARSQETARPPRDWNRDKIAAAERSGPQWDGAQVTAGELYADLEKDLAGPLADAVSGSRRGKKPGAGSSRSSRSTQGKSGKPSKPTKGGEAGQAKSRLPLVVGLGALGLVALGLAFAFGFGPGKGEGKGAPSPARVAGVTPNPGQSAAASVADPAPSGGESAGAGGRKELLESFRSEVRSLIEQGRFGQAVALKLPEALKRDAAALQVHADLVAEAQKAASAKLGTFRPRFQQHLSQDRFAAAEEVIGEIRAWAPVLTVAGWEGEVKDATAREADSFLQMRQRLSLAAVNENPLMLTNGLQKGAVRAYASGGLVGQYLSARDLVKDTLFVRGPASSEVTPAPSGVRGLYLSAGRQPLVAAWRPELRACLRVRLRLELRQACGAVLVGVDSSGREGVGIDFRAIQAELSRRGVSRQGSAEAQPLDGPLDLELTLREGARPQLMFQVGSEARRIELAPDRLPGRLGVAVDRGEAWIVRLEVWALVR